MSKNDGTLSAEPLVGLKQTPYPTEKLAALPFSRTPRGFEAHRIRIATVQLLPFSRTPRGFEAPSPVLFRPASYPFSRTPRGFEARRMSRQVAIKQSFQPNPSWV